MGSIDWQIELESLLDAYNEGLYTEGEISSLCIEMLAKCLTIELWNMFPDWVKNRLIKRLINFSEKDEIITFGQGDPFQAKLEMLNLKAWLINEKIITPLRL